MRPPRAIIRASRARIRRATRTIADPTTPPPEVAARSPLSRGLRGLAGALLALGALPWLLLLGYADAGDRLVPLPIVLLLAGGGSGLLAVGPTAVGHPRWALWLVAGAAGGVVALGLAAVMLAPLLG